MAPLFDPSYTHATRCLAAYPAGFERTMFVCSCLSCASWHSGPTKFSHSTHTSTVEWPQWKQPPDRVVSR